ncbi:putative uncharacterized protein DDB_G0282133 [Bradysia coprophila]|uniref:putative uncharacterized protein DDB_G0282133 n=1 Tax=Bradysia coprophila TaxID=38358 RepID=UPI00187DD5BF|nr:putative uncharacterized protein DDB_G0282133 [Bradysia coprophila]XP_037040078.1 putative uncharacterized protein DDB_G0282133 [Bradysia coprophila]
MGHRQSKNQRPLALPKNDKRAKDRPSKRASALRSSIIIKIRMLKMESKDLTNNLNVKCDQRSKCSCNDNNGHQSTNPSFNNQNTTITTLPSPQNQYIQPDAQSNKMKNEEIEHLEDRINQINNDNSTTFVARRNQYNNRSSNSINNNIINDNEINSDAIGRNETEGKASAICDNVTSESDRIQMELKNIGVNNYKRSNLMMHRGCDIRNIPNAMLLSSLDQQFVDSMPANTKTMNNSSIYPNANNATTVTTPSTSKGPDYIPMAPIKSSDKIATEQNFLTNGDSELANSFMQMGLPSNDDCTKDPKDKETKSKITNWSKKFNCVKILSPKSSSHIQPQQQQHQPSSSRSQRQTGSTDTNNSIVRHSDTRAHSDHRMAAEAVKRLLDMEKFNPLEYPTEDCDEVARVQRAREIHEGVDPPPGYRTICTDPVYVAADPSLDNRLSTCSADDRDIMNAIRSIPDGHIDGTSILNTSDTFPNNLFNSVDQQPRVIHSQVDFIHCLVPDLRKITNCGFYWGKMDRYEAERLLEGKPEGTFLLRDSAQEEFLFSVSFRKYGRSLHARIEQFNHKFSFDCHDPGVFTSPEVTGLLEHYKDPACVMFFEPALTQPLNRNFCFTLQQLCRSLIVSSTTYDGVNDLPLPSTLKSYLKEYHYKQRVRVRRYDQ